jgi:hypothetical protein
MVLKCKRVSYGLVELHDSGSTWARYSIRVNGTVHEVSDNLQEIMHIYDTKYY